MGYTSLHRLIVEPIWVGENVVAEVSLGGIKSYARVYDQGQWN